MNLQEFKSKITGLLKIDTAKAQLAEAVAEIESLTETNTKLQAEIEDYKKTIAAFPLAKQDWEAETVKLKENHAAEISKLNEQIKSLTSAVEAEQDTENKKAAVIMQAVGISADAIKPTVTSLITPTDVLNKLNELTGEAKTEFYNKHRETILKALKLIQ